ncbi:MAG: hypothetical protein QXP59_03220 [Saccharolobus sp.]
MLQRTVILYFSSAFIYPSKYLFDRLFDKKIEKGSIVERPYALIKSVFHGDHVLVTTVIRVLIKAMFMRVAYNLKILTALQ